MTLKDTIGVLIFATLYFSEILELEVEREVAWLRLTCLISNKYVYGKLRYTDWG